MLKLRLLQMLLFLSLERADTFELWLLPKAPSHWQSLILQRTTPTRFRLRDLALDDRLSFGHHVMSVVVCGRPHTFAKSLLTTCQVLKHAVTEGSLAVDVRL